MMRRMFWFVLGAVTGVAAYVRVRALLGEAREAMTVRNVLAAMRAILAAVWATASGYASGFISGPDSGTDSASPDVPGASARRHIATRPSSRHG
ncbi:MAG: hypothetical protein ACKOFF_00460 [Acidimicrobiales bacterium]